MSRDLFVTKRRKLIVDACSDTWDAVYKNGDKIMLCVLKWHRKQILKQLLSNKLISKWRAILFFKKSLSKYKDEMTKEEAIALAIEAISAGIFHDLGSGSHVDYCVITKDKVDMNRNAVLNENLPKINL